MKRYASWMLSPGSGSRSLPRSQRPAYAAPGMCFNDGGGAPNAAPGAPPSPPADAAAEQARLEAQKRLEAEAQANRSLRGRLRKLEGLRPDASDQDIADLIAAGLKAKQQPVDPPDGDDSNPDPDDDKEKRKATTIGRKEHLAAIAKERETLQRTHSAELKKISDERDSWKSKYLDREVDAKLAAICPETVNLKAATAAIKAGMVPYHFEIDENSGELLVLDASGNDYRGEKGFMTAPEALASMVKLVPWVADVKPVTGAGSGGSNVNGAPQRPSQREQQAANDPLSKIKLAVTAPQPQAR